jgi:hypothetical protein
MSARFYTRWDKTELKQKGDKTERKQRIKLIWNEGKKTPHLDPKEF